MGKSSLVKAVHAEARNRGCDLKIIEIQRDDLDTLPTLLSALAERENDMRAILFCDDLSFDVGETRYKTLKAVLEGGLEGSPDNVVVYATSNRRHAPRAGNDRERSRDGNQSLRRRRRKGVAVGPLRLASRIPRMRRRNVSAMVRGYAERFAIPADDDELVSEALTWATERGGRSGRVAMQFIRDIAARKKIRIVL